MSGLRDRLLATVGQRRYLDETVEGIGPVRFQSLSERERSEFERIIDAKPEESRAYLLTRTLVDGEGKRVFADDELSLILELDAAVSTVLGGIAMKHISPSAVDLGDEVKN